MSDKERQVPIWFFIGIVLTVYGLLVLGAGLYQLLYPPEKPLPLSELHPAIWWGALMVVVGMVYCVKFPPRKGRGGIDALE